jgi:hypothetical protein
MPEILPFMTTPARRRAFYARATHLYNQDQVMFVLLVAAFREGKRKRQALLLQSWFLQDNAPEAVKAAGYVGLINIEIKDIRAGDKAVTDAVAAVGLTLKAKQETHGFFGGLAKAVFGNTALSDTLFDPVENAVRTMLTGDTNFDLDKFKPDSIIQPNGVFAAQAVAARTPLTEAGFDTKSLGIY